MATNKMTMTLTVTGVPVSLEGKGGRQMVLADLQVFVDYAAIAAQLANRACGSAAKKATAMDGAIVVKPLTMKGT